MTHGHRRHFPTTTFDDFSILLVTVNANYRDRICREVQKKEDMHPQLWLFAERDDVTVDRVLSDDIFHDYRKAVGPLVPGLRSSEKGESDAA